MQETIARSSKQVIKKFQLLKTDSVVEGVHYLSSDSPIAVGYKAMARAMSDIAAMGGTPHHALVTLIINPSSKLSYIKSLYKGLSKAAALYEISIVVERLQPRVKIQKFHHDIIDRISSKISAVTEARENQVTNYMSQVKWVVRSKGNILNLHLELKRLGG